MLKMEEWLYHMATEVEQWELSCTTDGHINFCKQHALEKVLAIFSMVKQ